MEASAVASRCPGVDRRMASGVRGCSGKGSRSHIGSDQTIRGTINVTNSCRSCGAVLTRQFADLGMSPLSNAFLRPDQLDRMEPFYPLTAWVCDVCMLVQLPAVETPEN